MDAYISANPAAAAFAAVFTAAAAIAVSCESPDGAKATFGRRGARLFFPAAAAARARATSFGASLAGRQTPA
jgi:hypothetical protein